MPTELPPSRIVRCDRCAATFARKLARCPGCGSESYGPLDRGFLALPLRRSFPRSGRESLDFYG